MSGTPLKILDDAIPATAGKIGHGSPADGFIAANTLTTSAAAAPLTGTDGADTFSNTTAGFNGVTIANFGPGDKIVITDAAFETFGFSLDGNVLTYSGGQLILSSPVQGAITATGTPDGGVQLSIVPGAVATNDQIAAQLTTGYWNAPPHHWDVTQGGTLTVNISTLTAAEQTLARAALADWTDIIGVRFQEVATGGQIVFNDNEGTKGAVAQTFTDWSGSSISSATVQISKSWLTRSGSDIDSYSFQTYIHEIGHALGLGHAGDYNTTARYQTDALFPNDSWSTSIMSYFSPTENTYFSQLHFSYDYDVTPMAADIIAAQSLYGPSTTTRTGDSVYGFHSNVGGVYNALTYPAAAYTIFDSGGHDTLDFSGSTAAQVIDLNPETFSSVDGSTGNLQIARGVVIEDAIGGSGPDVIIGNSADNLLVGYANTDTLYGGDGNDTLNGGLDADYLNGGAGDDRIIYDPVDNPSQVTGGPGNDTLVVIDMPAPTGYNLAAGSFEAAEVTQHDSTGANSWSSIVSTYNASWQLTGQDTYNDDGTRTVTSYDPTNVHDWSQIVFSYGASGQEVSETYTYDDRTMSWVAIDAANSHDWSSVWFAYDAQNREISETYNYHDGSKSWVSFDANNAQDWSSVWFRYDAQGREVSETYAYDDGSKSWAAFDVGNAQQWSKVWFHYDAQGHEVSETYTYDDGSSSWVAFDSDNSQAWTKIWFSYDAQGRQTSMERFNDDGSRVWIGYDHDGTQPWSQDKFIYDPAGHLTEEIKTWHDGHVTDNHF